MCLDGAQMRSVFCPSSMDFDNCLEGTPKIEASKSRNYIGRLSYMGIRLCRAPVLPGLTGLCWVLCGLLASTSHVGCKSSGRSKVSSGLFLAPFTEPSTGTSVRGISLRAAKNDFLRAIRPNALESDFDDIQPEGFVMGRLSSDEIDSSTKLPKVTENLLVYDAQSSSIVSASLLSLNKSKIRLHYSTRGLQDAQGSNAVISTTVTPIKLKNGWIMAFDSSSKNIIAFREQRPRQITDELGTRTLPYRSALLPNGAVNVNSKNFGQGNGLFLSVVITGEDTLNQLRAASAPVTRFVEIEENKVLVFFSPGTIRAVHLLELEEQDVDVDFDLDPPFRPSEKLRVKSLSGRYKLFPEPLLTFRQIADTVTQDPNPVLDSNQPVVFTHPDLPAPFALVFDRKTSVFIKIRLLRGAAGEVIGASVASAITRRAFEAALQGSESVAVNDPPYDVRSGYQSSSGARKVFFFEGKQSSIIAYDPSPKLTPDNSVTSFVDASDFLFRRDPRGTGQPNQGAPEEIDFATVDIRLNRLAFDRDFRQLISVNYESGVVVVVASSSEISVVTKDAINDFTYIEPLDDNNVRVFDFRTMSLLDFKIEYTAFPITAQ